MSQKARNSNQRFRVVLAILSLLTVAALFKLFKLYGNDDYNIQVSKDLSDYTLNKDHTFRFAIVADLDRMSKDNSNPKKPSWKSIFQIGSLSFNKEENRWNVHWSDDEQFELSSHLGEAGRGMELSELIWYKNRLLAFDDRSGIIFQISNKDNLLSGREEFLSTSPDDHFVCVARYILTEGDGKFSPKGQKTEWATMKDGDLYVGSFGKEFTNPEGEIVHRSNLWISILKANGEIVHEDWKMNYELLRAASGTSFPGYMIHEAIMFNPFLRKWIVLPRRVSLEAYDEKLDELKGSNLLLIVNENFDSVEQIVKVGEVVPERGFSSFKFLPGSDGKVIVALKTVEKEDKETGESEQHTFISMFDLEGRIFVSDSRIPGDYKFEGLEFL